MKTVYTTGEAAKLCNLSLQTIIRCFDSGKLNGYRVPGSRFRRIPHDALLDFMRAYGLPTEALEGPKRKLLIVDDHTGLGDLLTQLLEKDGRFEIRNLTSGEPAPRELAEYEPELVVDIKPELPGMRVRPGNRPG